MANKIHATIIPLVGGEALASEKVFGERPAWIASHEPFLANDEHLRAYWDYQEPYFLVDKDEHPEEKVDVISTLCPCAGLSQVHNSYGADNPNNKWMIETTDYILTRYKPKVFWGENAPAFATDVGKPIRDRMYKTARENGYTMSVYKTKNILHGVPQIRNRTFYFFWRDSKTPILDYIKKPYPTIEETLDSVQRVNSFNFVVNPDTPSEHPYYKMIFDWGLFTDKQDLHDKIKMSRTALKIIHDNGKSMDDIIEWLEKDGNHPKLVERDKRRKEKVEAGHGIMDRDLFFVKNTSSAFVLYMPFQMIHHREDRFLTYRECMAMMGLPNDFMLLQNAKGEYNVNVVCQNVHTTTAEDMAIQVKKYLGGELPYYRNSTYTFQDNSKHMIDSWSKEIQPGLF